LENIIGYIAAFCTTAAFIPQVVKVYKTQKTNDISFGMFFLMLAGVGLWLVYGLLVNSYPIIAANFVTFLFALYIFIMKIKLDALKRSRA
jgi:MtN3 and saliva related transmembrane protein